MKRGLKITLSIVFLAIFLLIIGNISYSLTGKVIDESQSSQNATYKDSEIAKQLAQGEMSSTGDLEKNVKVSVKDKINEKNKIMEFNTPNGKIELSFDLLNYSEWSERQEEVEENVEGFNVLLNQTPEKYKWGYDVKLKDLKFLAKISVSSDSEIVAIDNQTLKVGKGYLSFADLTNEGYNVSLENPISVSVSNVSNVNVSESNETIVDLNVTEGVESNITDVNVSVGNESNSSEESNITEEVESNETLAENNETLVEDEQNVSENSEEEVVADSNESESGEEQVAQEETSEEQNEEVQEEVTNEGAGEENANDETQEEQVVEEETSQEETSEEAEPSITANVIRGLTGFVINGFKGFAALTTGFVVSDYTHTQDIYVQRDFTGTNYSIGDIIFLDPTFVYFTLSGTGTLADPWIITTCSELQDINATLHGNYTLGNNIDCSDTVNWNNGAGFDPIGNSTNLYVGTFDGANYNISNLYIYRPSENYVGLFSDLSPSTVLKNFGLINVSVYGGSIVGSILGLGFPGPSINNTFATGFVNGTSSVGGLVGTQWITPIENSYFIGNVTGGSSIGGIVGAGDLSPSGTLNYTHFIGNVTGTTSVGGLVGYGPYFNVDNSYAIANITGTSNVGGLLGYGFTSITKNSSMIGKVVGSSYVGGLIGGGSGSIDNSYFKGVASSGYIVGGFVGNLVGGVTINNSYSIVNLTGTNSGGLVGYAQSASIIDNSYVTGNVTGTQSGGLTGYAVSTNFSNSYSTASTSSSGAITGYASNLNFVNVYWYNHSGNPSNCYPNGNTGCTAVTSEEYFYSPANQPMRGWDFLNNKWGSVESGHPKLAWETGIGVEGSGSLADPYLITHCGELQEMVHNLGANYTLASNIDCGVAPFNSGSGFLPVGNDSNNKYTGTFNGANKTISNLYIYRSSNNRIGLFGQSDSLTLRDVGLTNVSIYGASYVGSFIGYGEGSSGIDNSYVTGNVNGTTQVGGLVGRHWSGALVINNTYFSGSIISSGDSGGLMGYGTSDTIVNSYTIANVTGTSNVGGMVAYASFSRIDNSYAVGNVSGGSSLGGITSYVEAMDNVYWNNHSGNPNDCYDGGNTGCTAIDDNEAYFYNVSNEPMVSWDFTSIWDNGLNLVGFAVLQWQADETSPVVNYSSSSVTSSSATLYFNVTDRSELTSCTAYVGSSSSVNSSYVNKSRTNSIIVSGLSASTPYSSYVSCTDASGNVGTSSNRSITTSAAAVVDTPAGGSGGSSGGGGGGSATTVNNTYFVNAESFKKGYKKILEEGERLKITAGSTKEREHYITLKKLELENEKITITVESVVQQFILKLGESVRADVDSDNVYDVLIEFRAIVNNDVEMYIKQIEEVVKPTDKEQIKSEGNVSVTEEESENENEILGAKSRYVLILGIVLLIIAFAVALVILLIINNKKRK